VSPSTLEINRLSDSVGVEVQGVTADQLATDAALAAAVEEALEAHGVLVFRDLHLEPEAQIEFCKKLGEIDYSAPNHPVPGIYVVSLDESKNKSAAYLHGTFHWHIDGCTPEGDECPQMATILTAVAVAEQGGETEFASTYAAYDDLTEDEKERLATLRVEHSLEASQRKINPEPTDAQLVLWRQRKTSQHPLVWTHRDGRRSLVLGASADHIVGIDLEGGRALLEDLLACATRPDRVYRHSWSVGDTVIWDNRGVLHRAVPYDAASPREMLRTTVLGDEPIQ
jgi:alpha-ketoglutarate-dependent taurine dioxygenase